MGHQVKRVAVLVSTLLVASGLGVAPAAGQDAASAEQRILEIINQNRPSGPNLVMHQGLRAQSRTHSQNMAAAGQLTHDGFAQRVQNAAPDPFEANGPPDDGFTGTACENVAFFQNPALTTVEQVAQQFYSQWFNSLPHRACMFNAQMNVAGIGLFRAANGSWWATMIAAVDTTPPQPTTSPTPPPTTSPPTGDVVQGTTFTVRRGAGRPRGGFQICADGLCTTSDRRSGAYSLFGVQSGQTLTATGRRGTACSADSPTGPTSITVVPGQTVDWYCSR